MPPTEKSLAWHIEKLSHELGADCMAFETIVAFGSNTSRPHHRPTAKKLQKGDIVQIDMGVKVHGYCSDCSRVFFTGMPTEEQQQVFDLLKKIAKETTRMAKAGVSNRTLDTWARNTLKKTLIPTLLVHRSLGEGGTRTQTLDVFFLHSLGHGVGLEIHEGINLTSKNVGAPQRGALRRNEVITIEPGIYFAEKWGMRIEDTVLVTRKVGKALTRAKIQE